MSVAGLFPETRETYPMFIETWGHLDLLVPGGRDGTTGYPGNVAPVDLVVQSGVHSCVHTLLSAGSCPGRGGITGGDRPQGHCVTVLSTSRSGGCRLLGVSSLMRRTAHTQRPTRAVTESARGPWLMQVM